MSKLTARQWANYARLTIAVGFMLVITITDVVIGVSRRNDSYPPSLHLIMALMFICGVGFVTGIVAYIVLDIRRHRVRRRNIPRSSGYGRQSRPVGGTMTDQPVPVCRQPALYLRIVSVLVLGTLVLAGPPTAVRYLVAHRLPFVLIPMYVWSISMLVVGAIALFTYQLYHLLCLVFHRR